YLGVFSSNLIQPDFLFQCQTSEDPPHQERACRTQANAACSCLMSPNTRLPFLGDLVGFPHVSSTPVIPRSSLLTHESILVILAGRRIYRCR
ncbi:hypothetical protein WG66_016748, partial [Moniliophthora roreri]